MKEPKKPRAPKKPVPFIAPSHSKAVTTKTIWGAECPHWTEHPPENYYEEFDPKKDAWEQWKEALIPGGKISLYELIQKCEGQDFNEIFIRAASEEDWAGVEVYREVEIDNPWEREMKQEEEKMRKEHEHNMKVYQRNLKEYEAEINAYAEKKREYLEWKKAQIEQELEGLK
jgi:hypothetical protein